jgi:hypothetical protein
MSLMSEQHIFTFEFNLGLEIYRGFAQSRQSNAGVVPPSKQRPALYTHHTVRRYTLLDDK